MRDKKRFLRAFAMACVLSGGLAFGGQQVHAAGDVPNIEVVACDEGVVDEVSTEDTANEASAEAEDTTNESDSAKAEEIVDDTAKLVKIDETNFPDPNFREIVKKYCDANKDGFLSELDVNNVYELDCSYAFDLCLDDGKIKSVKGIEYLIRLQELNLCNNLIEEIDLSQNPDLVKLNISENRIKGRLDLSQNTKLKVLDFSENDISEVDLSGLSDLEILDTSFNALGELDVSKNLNLKELTCNWNSLGSLDVSKNTDLIKLETCVNGLESLDVSMNTKLKELICSDDQLKELDVSHNLELVKLVCSNNTLGELDLTNNTALIYVDGYCTQLQSLDISQNTALECLYMGGNFIEKLDVSKQPDLEVLDINGNFLESLDLSHNKKLKNLYATCNLMKKIDISHCPRLMKLVSEVTPQKYNDDSFIGVIYDNDGESVNTDDWYYLSMDLEDILITKADSFEDIEVGSWYSEAVKYVQDNAFMNGTSKAVFSPDMTLTRAQFVTVLHNIEGGENLPATVYNDKFKDVPQNEWYTNPVMWALKNGITSGVSKDQFGTDEEITREQLATLLYKYAGTKDDEYILTKHDDALKVYPDATKVSDWAIEAMQWAVSHSIVNGKPEEDGTLFLDPNGKASRAECAQMIENFIMMTTNFEKAK